MNEQRIKEISTSIRDVKVAVYGDFCLDAYWVLDPRGSEVSLETGLQARAVGRHYYSLGGASFQPGSGFYSAFYASPYMDGYVVELARTLIEAESLGADADTDLLALCFSALDSVGHEYGPHSPEVLDVILRLDRTLGELFDELDHRIGMNHVAIALSADHGVMPLPEYLQSREARITAVRVASGRNSGRFILMSSCRPVKPGRSIGSDG